jgi:hypothetical protein
VQRRNVAKKPDRREKERWSLCSFLHGENLEVSKIYTPILFPVFGELETYVLLTSRFTRILGVE